MFIFVVSTQEEKSSVRKQAEPGLQKFSLFPALLRKQTTMKLNATWYVTVILLGIIINTHIELHQGDLQAVVRKLFAGASIK